MPKKGESKYNVQVGDIYKYWKVLKIGVMKIEGKNKDRKSYTNALCLCTKCNKNIQVISYSRLNNTKECFMCTECDGQKKKTTQEYIEELKIKNPLAKLIEGEIYINNRTSLIHICSRCGKEYDMTPESATLRFQHACISCSYIMTGEKIRKTTDEYIKELQIKNPFVKLKDGEEYITSDNKIIHICSHCGKDWSLAPSVALSGAIMCKECCSKLTESVHATLIKQVYKYHYKEDCIWEESIIMDNNTYEIDIVNHKKKEAIEIDGEQHRKMNNFHRMAAKKNGTTPEYEFEQQLIRDNKVNNYFDEIGYNLIRIEVDNKKSPLKALQELFPQYNGIPDWIDFSGKVTRHKWNVDEAQKLMNKGINRSEIARRLNIHQSSLNQAVSYGKLVIPKGYKSLNIVYWDYKTAQKLIDEGKKVREVADFIKVPLSTIRGGLDRKLLVRHNKKLV